MLGHRGALGRRLAGLVGSLVVLVVLQMVTASPAGAATLTGHTQSGSPGDTVDLSGEGFVLLLEVSLCWDGTGCSNLGTVSPGLLGDFTSSVTIPADAGPGNHTINACQLQTCSSTGFEVLDTVPTTTTLPDTTTTTSVTTTTDPAATTTTTDRGATTTDPEATTTTSATSTTTTSPTPGTTRSVTTGSGPDQNPSTTIPPTTTPPPATTLPATTPPPGGSTAKAEAAPGGPVEGDAGPEQLEDSGYTPPPLLDSEPSARPRPTTADPDDGAGIQGELAVAESRGGSARWWTQSPLLLWGAWFIVLFVGGVAIRWILTSR